MLLPTQQAYQHPIKAVVNLGMAQVEYFKTLCDRNRLSKRIIHTLWSSSSAIMCSATKRTPFTASWTSAVKCELLRRYRSCVKARPLGTESVDRKLPFLLGWRNPRGRVVLLSPGVEKAESEGKAEDVLGKTVLDAQGEPKPIIVLPDRRHRCCRCL